MSQSRLLRATQRTRLSHPTRLSSSQSRQKRTGMPQKRNNPPPPEVETWGKATPALVISGIFDALRLMFVGFIFFGPAMAGLYCDYKVSDLIGTAFGLTKTTCVAGAATLGFFGAPAFMAFGTVMGLGGGGAGWVARWVL